MITEAVAAAAVWYLYNYLYIIYNIYSLWCLEAIENRVKAIIAYVILMTELCHFFFLSLSLSLSSSIAQSEKNVFHERCVCVCVSVCIMIYVPCRIPFRRFAVIQNEMSGTFSKCRDARWKLYNLFRRRKCCRTIIIRTAATLIETKMINALHKVNGIVENGIVRKIIRTRDRAHLFNRRDSCITVVNENDIILSL